MLARPAIALTTTLHPPTGQDIDGSFAKACPFTTEHSSNGSSPSVPSNQQVPPNQISVGCPVMLGDFLTNY